VRRPRLGVLALVAVVASSCGGRERPGTPPRNAVLITVAGLRADRVGALGYPRPTTATTDAAPNAPDLSIDGLARSGVAFASAFAPSADDEAALRELVDGVRGADERSLAESFAAAGFRTAAFVTGAAASEPALVRGFDHVALARGDDPDYAAVRDAVTWLRETAGASDEPAPFFLWVHLSGPAAPWDPAALGQDDVRARFVDPDYGAGDAPGIDGSAATLAAIADGEVALDGLGVTHLANLYDAEVARTARLVEQLTTCLAGRYDLLPRDELARTAVVFAGTRGVELFQHGPRAEDPASLYDASLRVPLVLRHPASLTGRRVLAGPVELRDVAPTLRAWLGVADEAPRSLLNLCDAHPSEAHPGGPVVLRRANGGSVRTADRHLIVRDGGAELFDPARDPLERIDLAADEPDTVAELSGLLAAD